jgi:hypothetical protein
MAASARDEIVVEIADRPPSPKRPSRTLKPSAKVREAMQSIEDATIAAKTTTNEGTRIVASRGTRALGTGHGVNGRSEAGKSSLQVLLEAINEQRNEMHEVITEQRNTICELRDAIQATSPAGRHQDPADRRAETSTRPDRCPSAQVGRLGHSSGKSE